MSLLLGLFVVIIICVLIFLLILRQARRRPRPRRRARRPAHLLVVLGSGGHTEEMISMLRRANLDFKSQYSRRTYVVSSGDEFSARKAAEFEEEAATVNFQGQPTRSSKRSSKHSLSPSSPSSYYTIITIPRARRVHQSFFTAPISTLQCFLACLRVLQGQYPNQQPNNNNNDNNNKNNHNANQTKTSHPDVILTNGPGTAVCVIVAAKLLRIIHSIRPYFCLGQWLGGFDAKKRLRGREGEEGKGDRYLRTIFIESWARVTTLSLSGRIVLPIVDRFLVQWESIDGYTGWFGVGRTEYVGTLVC